MNHITTKSEKPTKSSRKIAREGARKCAIAKNSLNEQQKAAIEMLALGKAYGATAKALNINAGTLYRWRQDETFDAALQERRREVWGASADRLKDLVHASLEVLAEQLANPYDRARFRAAGTVLRLVKSGIGESR